MTKERVLKWAPVLLAVLTIGVTAVAARSSLPDAAVVAAVGDDEGAAIRGGTTTCPRYLSTTTGCGFNSSGVQCQDYDIYYPAGLGVFGTISYPESTCKVELAPMVYGETCGVSHMPSNLTCGCSGS